jgi:YggT family protein
MQSALLFLVQTIADLYLLTLLLRFIMQWVRATHYNPLAQFIFKVTNPLIVPARRVLPSVAGLDAPTLVVLLLLEIAVTFLLLTLVGASVPVPDLLFYAVLRLISLTLLFYTVALLIHVLFSWFGSAGNPMAEFLDDLVEPLLRPVRRVLPPIAGLDLSPLAVMLLLQAVRIALPFPPFFAYLR